ncbi:ATP-grasp domain-containing protein [Chryseobacterium vrystaatense]|uniref:Ribosomal protein S6--L-glutamate ligase n=1 Tax=Chryseobacterium vrystaatense TaxID=307480 RepID=A0A1M4Z1D3_9FLAO|nr:ATP-grasp domain-containing protein [Chryseobacterium vrystaatense]SHF11883.1 ribosomal protein S6--L-glutamate ligase [Chryseobacterium vrystaatense]
MKTVLLINGEKYWKDYFGGFNLVQKNVQTSECIVKDSALYFIDAEGVCKPDVIFWRLGAVNPDLKHRNILELIEYSGIPCVNSTETLLKGYDRLSMLNTLKKLELPVINFDTATKTSQLKNLQRSFPFVVKVGNHHGGFGKSLVTSEEQWEELKDLLFIHQDYVTVEKFIDYKYDIRYLAINDKVWAMKRKGKYWKANSQTQEYQIIAPEKEWIEKVKLLQEYTKADIIAIDVLETENGEKTIVEYNDIPGLSGFPEDTKLEISKTVKNR